MAHHSPLFKRTHISTAVALCIAFSTAAWGQQIPTEITVTDKLPARVSGFSDVSAYELPFSTIIIDNATLQDIGAQRVSDALLLDASVTDNYNAPAYWDILSVRGFTLNNRYNYQREGLPINAETMIPLDNKERIELLKGTSGMQAGTSAPGGLVNYIVKRAPTNSEQKIRNITLSYGEGNNRLVAADLGGRFGQNAEFGYRLNIAYQDLDPYVKNATGQRDLAALAMDFRLNSDTRLEWEIEQSHRKQIGSYAYSLLGNKLPPTVDGTQNITYQPWTPPQVFDALTGSVRLKQNLTNGWLWTTQYGTQRLRTDDQLPYAFGCSAEGNFDRYCSNGSFDLYDYRSNNERRTTEAIQTELSGSTQIGGLNHDLVFTAMRYRQLNRLPSMRADNLIGTGNIDGTSNSSPDPTTTSLNTNRTDYTNEFGIKDRIHLSDQTSAWLGLRQLQINRQSALTDGSNSVRDERNITTPWVALSHSLDTTMTIYASYGQGIETEVVPNRSMYTNAGQSLPVLRSRQQELGIKNQSPTGSWQITFFDITRPVFNDTPTCDSSVPNSCTRQLDGEARHRGLELNGAHIHQNWKLGGGLTWLHATRQNASIDPTVNGQRPINVPSYILRGVAEYRYSAIAGLRTGIRLSHEGERNVTENGDIKLPAWTTFDAFVHYDTQLNNTPLTWTFAISNLQNKQYWREAPKQFGHYYLFPGAPRTFRATVQFSF